MEKLEAHIYIGASDRALKLCHASQSFTMKDICITEKVNKDEGEGKLIPVQCVFHPNCCDDTSVKLVDFLCPWKTCITLKTSLQY